ncbi:hypothetical protein llap_15274 [Limosa lapponica baueri]|uniref:Uncharacterized protein n=1 Tax=Limosa lapponica baueri TaxID=1758121 RepID=A0A2I0TKY2_LIMLA|nr:hypothetical protein llap_15274 [Limosa lapponica baueri]
MLNYDADFLELQLQVEINMILCQMKWTPALLCALGINSEKTEGGGGGGRGGEEEGGGKKEGGRGGGEEEEEVEEGGGGALTHTSSIIGKADIMRQFNISVTETKSPTHFVTNTADANASLTEDSLAKKETEHTQVTATQTLELEALHSKLSALNHESLKVAFTESAYSSNPSARISCLAPTPQISVLSDEYSRPAVIGHARSFGSYPDSAEAIKDILVSVLNASGLKPSLVLEQATMQGAERLDSDMEQWEESSDGDSHGDSDSDSARHNAVCTQTDIRFTRHRACWDNTHCDSSKPSPDTFFCPRYSDGDPAASSLNGFTLSDVSPLKQDCFTQVTLTGGTVTSAVVCSGTERYTSPERDLTFTRFLPNSAVGKPGDLLKYPDALEPPPISNGDSNSPNGLSQSEPVNRTELEDLENLSVVPDER